MWSCIMPGLPMHLVQELDVDTVHHVEPYPVPIAYATMYTNYSVPVNGIPHRMGRAGVQGSLA